MKKPRLTINHERREVFLDGTRVSLAPKEYEIVAALRSADRLWTREELLKKLWGEAVEDTDVQSRTVDQHVARLRRKLHGRTSKRHGGQKLRAFQEIVETVPLYGYRLATGI